MSGKKKKERSPPKCSEEDLSRADLDPNVFDEDTRITFNVTTTEEKKGSQ